MKCERCLKQLAEYFDGELLEQEAAPLSAHLITCSGCAREFEALTAEQEIYARYDRALDCTPLMWSKVAERTTETGKVIVSGSRFGLREWFVVPSFGWSFAGAMVVLIFAVVIGVVYLRPTKQAASQGMTGGVARSAHTPERQNAPGDKTQSTNPNPQELVAAKNPGQLASRPKAVVTTKISQGKKSGGVDQSDVLFSIVAYAAVEERDTQRHIEQAQNLLRSVRNIKVSDDEEIDVSFEKALARRLLNQNVVLRRDAEMSGNFPTKMLLSDLEPFLIDIANLPDKPAPDDLRVIKERVLKTEIVAALQSY